MSVCWDGVLPKLEADFGRPHLKEIRGYQLSEKISVPKGAMFLKVDGPYGRVWFLVDPEQPNELRQFELVPTGEPFDCSDLKYIGSYWIGPEVKHVFERYPVRTFGK